jgi:peptidoglycan/LPS O-acetylase OafA/YrhL
MNRERIDYLDVYRALAILAVLMIHTTSSVVASLPHDSGLFPVYVALNSAAHYAVPAFLFLSALVLFYNYDGRTGIHWGKFYLKRLTTIIVPYVIWSFFYFLLVNHIRGRTIQESWPKFLEGLWLGSNYTHLYYIVVLVQFLVLFPLLLQLTRLKWIRSNLILIGIVLQIGFYLGNYYEFHMNKIGTFIGSYLIYIFLGAQAGIKLKSSPTWLRKPNGLLYGAVLLLAANHIAQELLQILEPHYLQQPWLSRVNYLAVNGYSAVCCYFLIHLSAALHARGWGVVKLLKALGVVSFGVYLIHPFILYFWRSRVMMNGPILYHVLVWGGGAAALIIPWLATLFFQRFKWGGLLLGMDKIKVKKANPEG